MTSEAPRVLIVDDDPEITSVLARGLALHGYETRAAHGTNAALGLLDENGISAAIVDVMIGADSGLDLVREMRAKGCAIPVRISAPARDTAS